MESRPKESVVHRVTESQENFQKFLYELFEKNGILSNLRAHLRSNIVEVLRTAQSGNSLPAQKKFTQRLELYHQALNILIVEHLISMEFNYTLSVFVSEVPLANMVFDFAKALFDGADNRDAGSKPRFKENDIWSILNILGVKCDSEFTNNVLAMYQAEQSSLIMCILKYMPYYYRDKEPNANFAEGQSSTISSHSSIRMYSGSRDFLQQRLIPPNQRDGACKHLSTCNECKKRLHKFKKKILEKKERGSSAISVECFMRSVEFAERHIMEEMFEQIKTVYEAEVEMYKTEEERRLKRTLINHAQLLKQRRDEMEANFKEREAELFRNVNQKKKFLWGLATSLRTQHAQMSQAMIDVRRQTELLAEKEDNIRAQLIDAEKSLRTRGEEMRAQISNELQTLERHLECLKMEREKINSERNELEQLKNVCEKAEKIASEEHLNTKDSSNFDVLKNEIATLKHYLENTKRPKCFTEIGTSTDNVDLTSDSVLNNEQSDRNVSENEGRLGKLNQVVNDLKKSKNVNFCQGSLTDMYKELLTAASSTTDAVDKLKIENEQLKTISKQQKDEIERLVRQQAELQARVGRLSLRENTWWRPSTAPPTLNINSNSRAATFGPHKGAGEELSAMCVAVQPRVFNVGEPVPFVTGIENKTDTRKYLMSQWRKLRRLSPPSPKQHHSRTINKASTSHDHASAFLEQSFDRKDRVDERPPKIRQDNVQRQKSPKSMLREAKEKLKNKDRVKQCSKSPRHNSPSSVLREAKLRLRKLELQAEAVEQSYQNFRRKSRHDGKPSSSEKVNEDYKYISDAYVHSKEAMQSLHHDYDNYLSQTKVNLGNIYFKNQNTSQMNKSKHASQVAERDSKINKENYLDIPLSEFRKLYLGFDEISKKNNSTNSKDERNKNLNLQDNDKNRTDDGNENSEAKNQNAETIHELRKKNENLQEKILENNEQNQQDFEQGNAQDTNVKEHDLESNPSVSRDIPQKTESLKTSFSDKEMQFETLKNDINNLYTEDNKQCVQEQDYTEIEKLPNEKPDETSSHNDDEAKSQYSELNTNNLLRVEINSISAAEKSIRSSKLLVVVESTITKDNIENQVVVSPTRNSYDDTYHMLDDLSVGSVKDDVLASGEGIKSVNNLYDSTNEPSDCTTEDDEQFFGNLK